MVLIDCGVRPIWPMVGTPRSTRKAMVSAMRRPPSSLIAPQPVSFITRVADQNEIAMAIKQARGMRVVGREADDRLAALARADVGGGQPLDLDLCRHWRKSYSAGVPKTATPTTMGWKMKPSAR